jgi:hypothetical protein
MALQDRERATVPSVDIRTIAQGLTDAKGHREQR